jgi:hypothetical protein
MSEQDFQDQISDDVASELHTEDVDPEAVSDETDDADERGLDEDRSVPEVEGGDDEEG